MEMWSVEAVARFGQMAKSDDEILNGFILGWCKIEKFLLCFIKYRTV
jgi:hypothetical protein